VLAIDDSTDVKETDRFIDIGSGLGTVVLQMAATTGCKATVSHS